MEGGGEKEAARGRERVKEKEVGERQETERGVVMLREADTERYRKREERERRERMGPDDKA